MNKVGDDYDIYGHEQKKSMYCLDRTRILQCRTITTSNELMTAKILPSRNSMTFYVSF